MQLKLQNEDEDDEQPEIPDEIKVFVQPFDKPPFFLQRHELTRWSEKFEENIENREIWLIDGFNGNWNEVQDCISLLKGIEVDVTFDNIKVITTFALTFDIVPLIEEINCWLKFNLKTETFGRTLKTIHMLGKLGFSEESLTNKIKGTQIVLNLVNNSSKESFKHLLVATVTDEEEQFLVGEFDEIILNTLCKSENNHLDVLLDVLVNKIDSNEKCKIVLSLFETIQKSNEADMLCVFWSEFNEVIDKIMTVSSDTEILKSAYACQKCIFDFMSKTECASPKKIRLELVRRTRCWRQYSVDDIKLLNKNQNLKCWHFAEIVLDWIDVQGPDFSTDFETIDELRKMANNGVMKYLKDYYSSGLCNYSIQIIEAFDRLDHTCWIGCRRVKCNFLEKLGVYVLTITVLVILGVLLLILHINGKLVIGVLVILTAIVQGGPKVSVQTLALIAQSLSAQLK